MYLTEYLLAGKGLFALQELHSYVCELKVCKITKPKGNANWRNNCLVYLQVKDLKSCSLCIFMHGIPMRTMNTQTLTR